VVWLWCVGVGDGGVSSNAGVGVGAEVVMDAVGVGANVSSAMESIQDDNGGCLVG
jgi:hypothetical protein